MQSKELQQNKYAMNITCDHTPLLKPACSSARDRKHARALDLERLIYFHACMYVQLSNESSILQANCQPINHPAKRNWLE